MKTNKIFIILILFFGTLISCNSYDDPTLDQNEFLGNPQFDISIDKIDLDLNSKNVDVEVVTNTKWWTVKSNSAWARVVSDTLYGSAKIQVKIDENETTDTRIANLTLQSGVKGPKQTIVVTQKGHPSHVDVSNTSITTSGYGGVYEVDITSNATWTVKVNKLTEPNSDWIIVSPMTGFENGKIAITINKNVNEAIGSLKATITVSVADEARKIAIEQIGSAACDAPNNTETLYFNDFFPCEDAAVGSTWTLTDPRDNTTYRVRLMADGNIWMIDDLKFAGDTGAKKANLNIFNGNGETSISGHMPGYWGDVTDIKQSWAPTNRGYIYGWQTVMQNQYARNAGGYSTNLGNIVPEYQGIAPDGWQVPAIEQYEALYTKIGFNGMETQLEVVYGGNINFDGSGQWGANGYASYWTITQKNRDMSVPGSAINNDIWTWRVTKASSAGEKVVTARNYGHMIRLLKKKNK